MERQFSTRVKTIRSDNGSEFTCLTAYFAENGIVHDTSCVGTPQQNGRMERKHRHILNTARALRFQANLPVEFWGYCAHAAGYLINRTPTKLLGGKTPYELVYNRPPPLAHLRVFCCLCYVHNQKHGGGKFEARGHRSVFIGYPFSKKGWIVYNLDTGIVQFLVMLFSTNQNFHILLSALLPRLLLYLIPRLICLRISMIQMDS